MMKVIFFGLGSIGKRHLKNLISYGKKNSINFDITAYSSSGKKEFEEITYIQNRDDLDTHYDIAFITNPTFKHLETLNVIVVLIFLIGEKVLIIEIIILPLNLWGEE